MSFENFARTFLVVGAVVTAVTLGCSSSKSDEPPTFCSQSKASLSRCEDKAAECDAVLSEGCGALEGIVTTETLVAARDCLESGVCGASTCLARGQKSAVATSAHKNLAKNFCTFCAPDLENCETQFYARNGRLPGRLLLPYADKIVKAVDEACTGVDGCQAGFNECARAEIERAIGRELEDNLTGCVVKGFSNDEGEGGGPGGGGQVAKCTAANCQGCCRDDICQEGKDKAACGDGASACETCTGTQECSAGKCKNPCGPDNCPGCCDATGTCVLGTAADKCGDEGAACQACTGGLVCSNKQCIDASCQATCVNGCCTSAGCQPGTAVSACGTGGEACVDCGPGRSCNLGACALDPNSTWDVYVAFAVVPGMNGTAAWDAFNGAPDPYLEAYATAPGNNHSGYTTTKTDTTVPFWQETPLKNIRASVLLNLFRIEIWDEDVDFDDFLGGCTIPLTAAIFDGSLQTYKCAQGTTGGEVEVHYRINPHVP